MRTIRLQESASMFLLSIEPPLDDEELGLLPLAQVADNDVDESANSRIYRWSDETIVAYPSVVFDNDPAKLAQHAEEVAEALGQTSLQGVLQKV